MITCPNCSAQNADGSGFCDQCGTPLAAGPAPVAPPPSPAQAGASNVCPNCSAAVVPGEAFCDNCGAELSSVVPAAPPVAPQQPAHIPPAQPYVPPPPSSPQPPVGVGVGSAHLVAGNGQSFSLTGRSSYLIGREDAVSGIFPDVDTAGSGGEEGGVSRRHAEIVQQGNQWLIQDLNSVNGTWVNNQRVAPGSRQPLNPGDQIRLGKWVATFQL